MDFLKSLSGAATAALGMAQTASSSASSASKTASKVNKIMYISMLIIAMILIAVSISQFAAYNWVPAFILMLFGGGMGYLGYTLMTNE